MVKRKMFARVGAICAALFLCVAMVLPAAIPSSAYSNSGRTPMVSPYQMTIAWWGQSSDGTATTVYERPLWNSFDATSTDSISWFGVLPGTTNGIVNELAYLEPAGLVDYGDYDNFAYHIGFNKAYNVSRVVIEMEGIFYNVGSPQDVMFKIGCLDAGVSYVVTMEGYKIERTETESTFTQTLTPFSYTHNHQTEAEEMTVPSLFPDDCIVTKFQIVAGSVDVASGFYMNDLYIETPAWTVEEVTANNGALADVLSASFATEPIYIETGMDDLGSGILGVAESFLGFQIAPGLSLGGVLGLVIGVVVVTLVLKFFGGG